MGKLRDAILTIWQREAFSPDEPDNAGLVRWVERVVRSEKDASQQAKDAFRRIENLQQTLKQVTALPQPQGIVIGATVGHLNMALMDLKSTRNRVTGQYVNPERQLPSLPPLDDAIARVKDAKALLLGEPIEPCPGGCGIDLAHPGNPDRQCACPKRGPVTWTFEPGQVDALKALLSLVHQDELAHSWWQQLPDDVREVLA